MHSYVSVKIGSRTITASTDSDARSEVGDQIMSVRIRDASGKKATDTCEITLNDADDQFVLPKRGEDIEVTLGRDDFEGAGVFVGSVDSVSSRSGRGSGQVLVVEAKSADMRGGLKTRKEKHLDDATFEEAARAFAPEGITVKVHPDLAQMRQDYWYLGRENFMHWAQRTADEFGATFKVMGAEAVFVPIDAGQTVTGRPLETITAKRGVNIINWDLSPDNGRPDRQEFEVTWYDAAEAKWKTQDGTIKAVGEGGAGTYRFSAADQDTAERMSRAMKKKAERAKGGGTVTIDGNPAAQAEAICFVEIRPGISGTYQIVSVEHSWTRGSGFITELELKRPQGKAGEDDR